MSDLNLKTFDKLYPMIIHKYDELFDDQNANIMDRINTIVNYLNQVGKLTNDVVKDWNVVYQWVMNDGLTTDVNNKIEAMRASGELDTVLQSVFNSIAGDKTTLHTTAKDTLVNAINEVDDLAKSNQTKMGDLTTLTTADKDTIVHAINDNVASLAQKAQQSDLLQKTTDKVNATTLGLTTAGLSSDATTNANAINSALTNYNEVYIPQGTYYISSSIIIPDGKRLIMSKQCTIKPTTDFDVIVFGNQIYMENGIVDVSGLSTFTHSALINASKSSGSTSYSIINGFTALRGSTYSPSGNGITLQGNSSYKGIIAFCRFEQFFLQYFDKAININTDGSSSYWANTNYFSGTSSVCNSAVNNSNGGGNTFNIFGQAGKSTTKPAVYSNGISNTFSGYIYDIGNSGNNQIYYELDGTGNNVVGNIPPNQIIDHTAGSNNTQISSAFKAPSKGKQNVSFNGAQDNFLICADLRFAVTETFTNVSNPYSVSPYPLKNAFRSFGRYGVDYTWANPASTSDNVAITIDLGGANYITSLGITTIVNQHAKQVMLSVFSTYDNVWHDMTFYPNSGGVVVWDITGQFGLSYNVYTAISKLKVTLYQPYAGNARVAVTNIFASNINGAYGFLPMDGGTIYGDVDLSKNKMKNMVLDQGATGSRPSNPVVGQVFYDTTLGKPIYCKVGGASPTWTDASGTTV